MTSSVILPVSHADMHLHGLRGRVALEGVAEPGRAVRVLGGIRHPFAPQRMRRGAGTRTILLPPVIG